MKNLTLENIAKACSGSLFLINGDDAEKEASSVIIDSRKAEKDCVFIATKGERVDGHSFIPQVFDKGALCVICEDKPENPAGNYILVESSFQALKDIAEFYRMQLDVKIVGIAGSVGKTSTKEMIASVLSEKFNIQKTAGNFNNEVGVPLTLFSLNESHEIAVVEMGISDFGEMSRLSKIVKPDICVMTNIGPCHLENLGDLDGVLKAKTEIFKSMNPHGSVVLNGDDEKLRTVKKVYDKTPNYFGLDEKNDVYAENVINLSIEGSKCTICTKKGKISVRIHIPGVHHILNATAACQVGLLLGMNLEEIKSGIEKARTVAGRTNVISTEKYVIIDDCYNANPKSMKSAIDLLHSAAGDKVAIVGDMFELGDDEDELHGTIGDYLSEKTPDVVICIGTLSSNMYDRIVATTNKIYFNSLDEALPKIKGIIEEKTKGRVNVLVKASHGMQFSKIVELLQEEN